MPLPRAYFDMSVLLKIYLREEGSGRARRLSRKYRCLVSAIAPLEMVSALRRHLAGGLLTSREVERMERLIQMDRAYWDLIEVDRPVLEHAEETVRETGLRALDAIHIGSARATQAYIGIGCLSSRGMRDCAMPVS